MPKISVSYQKHPLSIIERFNQFQQGISRTRFTFYLNLEETLKKEFE